MHTTEIAPIIKNGKYQNSLPMREDEWGLLDVLSTLKSFLTNKAQVVPDPAVQPEAMSPVELLTPADTDLAVRWLGHSTLLIDIEGVRILTDPVWSERASPVRFAGPKRFYPPLIALEDLPNPDLVVISHNHYDHLDEATIRVLAHRPIPFIVPAGVGKLVQEWGVPAERIEELSWWEETRFRGIRVVCTPARHFSGRGIGDRNRTLWGSWSLIGSSQSCSCNSGPRKKDYA